MVHETNQQQDKGLSLAERVHPKYRPVFEKLSEADRAAVSLYFLPHGSKKSSTPWQRSRCRATGSFRR
jgi:hypothetical protein